MQLDRVDSLYDVVDPYSNYVQPQLEQIKENQLRARQIGGLQRSVQTLGRQTQSLRGVIIPQYYMNRSQYYPGFRQ
jgi:hypothetical protein